ncbi:MAG TPA: GGDEF domain-containing protein, partial [Thermoanaerobaculia bacterium]
RAGARDISVEFAALDYSAPNALHYAYKLDGYSHGWTIADAAHRVATFTNLAPGRYTLRVRATNRAGMWSAKSVALELRALPAWYETWWFRALLAVVLVALVILLVRVRTALLRQRAAQLEATVAARTSELAVANAALENMTITDALTGLRNRRFLMQRIDEEIALALRQKSDLLFFLIDIDHFKAVNDTLGHAAGDRVLQQMRERLESVFRSSDYMLRWGGEEFLVMTRGSSRDDAPEIAERLRMSIARRPFVLDGGELLPKTASIGFAAFPFVPASPRAIAWTQVVDLADHALYVAKNGGRNTWAGIAAMPDVNAEELTRLLVSSVDDAIGHAALELLRPETDAGSAAARS